jgi:adenylate cyclase
MRHLLKLNPLILTLAAIILGTVAYLSHLPFLEEIELRTVDLRFRWRGPIPTQSKVVMAVIDEKSVNQEGKWVWPREKFTRLINKLSEAGASVGAFDIGFLEESDRSALHTITEIQKETRVLAPGNHALETYLDELSRKAESDRQLAQAIAASRTKIVLGYFFHMDQRDLAHVPEADFKAHQERIRKSAYPLVRYSSPGAQALPMIEAVMPQSNIEVISEAASYAGYFNMFPDPDGVVRWIPAVIKHNGMLYAPLSLMALSAYGNYPLSVSMEEYGVEAVHVGPIRLPTDELGRLLINYRGPAKTFPHIPITDILNDRVPRQDLEGKIVMVGATAVGIYDLRVTPFGSVFPGLEIHANVADSILARDFLQQPSWAAFFDLAAMILMGLLIWQVQTRTGVLTGAAAAAVLFAGHIGICQYLFVSRGWILNMIYPLLVLGIAYLGITIFKYVVESRQKKFIRDAFSTYLAPTVVKKLIDAPESLVLGGEEREITAFFSDVQGFTSISERLSARELVELLNEFLTEMTDIILTNEGTVDKFEGDAIIAFFGAPNEMPNHAAVACRVCIQMQQRLSQLRAKWREQGRPELKMRIGLNTGIAVVGNMGSKQRMDYTMMGDSVNTAARLEGVNKVYGTYTMISASTYKEAATQIVARELDAISVVGKSEPVAVYELMDPVGEASADTLELIEVYRKGLEAYRRRDWEKAIAFFNQALAIDDADRPSQVMVERCTFYKTNPPPENWNGAYTMTTK